MFNIILAGERFVDKDLFYSVCDDIVSGYQYMGYFLNPKEGVRVISLGGNIAVSWAKKYGISGVEFPLFPRHWADLEARPDNEVFIVERNGTTFNARAGHNRNRRVLEKATSEGDIAIVIAFYCGDAKGEKNLVKICKKAGVQHFIWDERKGKLRK